mgnify:CR=1 FL=1
MLANLDASKSLWEVVSDGLDRTVGAVLKRYGLALPYHANHLEWLGGDRWRLVSKTGPFLWTVAVDPELAADLWWTWNTAAREVFRRLDYPLWRQTAHNPVLMLKNSLSSSRTFHSVGSSAATVISPSGGAGQRRPSASQAGGKP